MHFYSTLAYATELTVLRLSQYAGTHLTDVARKGRNVTRRIYLPESGRHFVDDYINNERHRDDPHDGVDALFVSTGYFKGYLTRRDLHRALQRLAEKANITRATGKKIHVSAHKVRHTFGARVRQATGSDFETAVALGHRSTDQAGRYSRPTDGERDAALDTAFRFDGAPKLNSSTNIR